MIIASWAIGKRPKLRIQNWYSDLLSDKKLPRLKRIAQCIFIFWQDRAAKPQLTPNLVIACVTIQIFENCKGQFHS